MAESQRFKGPGSLATTILKPIMRNTGKLRREYSSVAKGQLGEAYSPLLSHTLEVDMQSFRLMAGLEHCLYVTMREPLGSRSR